MPFRHLVAAPEDLAKLSAAFDLAWVEINRRTPIEPTAQPGAREQLGYILIALWREDPLNDLAGQAVERYLQTPNLMPALRSSDEAKDERSGET